jgi:hypothetical protein
MVDVERITLAPEPRQPNLNVLQVPHVLTLPLLPPARSDLGDEPCGWLLALGGVVGAELGLELGGR